MHTSEMRGLCYWGWSSTPKLSQNWSWKFWYWILLYKVIIMVSDEIRLWIFLFLKYGKIWSVSVGHVINHKILISEECMYIVRTLWRSYFWHCDYNFTESNKVVIFFWWGLNFQKNALETSKKAQNFQITTINCGKIKETKV